MPVKQTGSNRTHGELKLCRGARVFQDVRGSNRTQKGGRSLLLQLIEDGIHYRPRRMWGVPSSEY